MPDLLRYGAPFPGHAARDAPRATVVRQPEPLALGVRERDKGLAVLFLDPTVGDAVLVEPRRPVIEGRTARYPELGRRDLAGARRGSGRS